MFYSVGNENARFKAAFPSLFTKIRFKFMSKMRRSEGKIEWM